MLVDSHCHLDYVLDSGKYNSIKEILEDAHEQGVTHFLSVCVAVGQIDILQKIAAEYNNIDISVGVHPNEDFTKDYTEDELVIAANSDRVVAIGETGLDYFRTNTEDLPQQQARFVRHINAAVAINKPLIIHTRDSFTDTIKLLEQNNAKSAKGVMHCFTGTTEQAMQALEIDFYISFSGIITFKNAKELQQTVIDVPLDKMLIETDSPYLAPMPFRGKTNCPAYVKHVAAKVAELKNVSYEEVVSITRANYFKLFHKS